MSSRRQRARRERRIERLRLGLAFANIAPLAIDDPLVSEERTIGMSKGLVVAIGAVVAHAAVIAGFFAFQTLSTKYGWFEIEREKIEVAVVHEQVQMPTPPPPPPPEVIDPPTPPPPPPKKKVKPPPPPPDPIDLPPEEPPKPDTPPPETVVGLNADSTVEGGAGPKFAVGNTRMGQTDAIAKDANDIKTLPKTTVVPDPLIIPPKLKKKRIEPEYPRRYREMEVVDTVTVKITVDDKGEVSDVELIKESKYSEFNINAKKAAKKDRYEPATRNGVPIGYVITLTYRFRLEG